MFKIGLIFTYIIHLGSFISIQSNTTYCSVDLYRSVICRTHNDFNITEEFEQISGSLPSNQKVFEELILYYVPIHELPDNAFADLQFKQISIHQSYNLTSIHSNAFNSTANITENLYIIQINSLVNNPPNYDLYAAISSLTNVKTLSLSLSDKEKHEIPENAFHSINGEQNNLEVIEFRGDFIISVINDNAFSAIPNIKRWIVFSYIHIEYISENAFDFSHSSEDRLEIHLNGCGLNESSFADNLFSGSQRPLYINLDNNNIDLINESTFANFFAAHTNNSISFANNSLNCTDKTQIQWLLDQKTELQNRLFNATCSDGISLWDIDSNITCVVSSDRYQIRCNSLSTPSTLKSDFKRIAELNPGFSFQYVEIDNNDLLTELPENVLMGISAVRLDIRSNINLKYIHKNAFLNSTTTTNLYIDNSPLINSPPEFDLYYALNTLVNVLVMSIDFDQSINHTIPDNAFYSINGSQNRLSTLHIYFDTLTRIGKNIFNNLPSISLITFYGVYIETVSTNAFDFESPSNGLMFVTFNSLKYIGFEDNMFNGSKRPMYLTFSYDYTRQYIEENIFSSFFSADTRNILRFIAQNVYLNCTDIKKFVWLLKQKEVLMDRIERAICNDGKSMWDLGYTEISWPTNIIIVNFNYTDIRVEFQRISSNQSDDQKHFEKLELLYAPINELQENSFADISLTQIYLHDLNDLTKINTNAFNGTEDSIEILQIIGLNALINDPPNNDLYASISSLINLKSVQIELANNIGQEIPTNAFKQINGPQNNLENIIFSGNTLITAINDNAFTAIPNLKTIVFSSITIQFINSKAFDFDVEPPMDQPSHNSNDMLEIYLNGCGLNESSLADTLFAGSQRPLYINLDDNNIETIKESTFANFFIINPNNSVSFANNRLDCANRAQIQWLLDRKYELQYRLLNATCSDGTSLWDIDNCYVTLGDNSEVLCNYTGNTPLVSEFERIAQTYTNYTHFNKIFIQTTGILTEISENILMGLTADELRFANRNLKSVHRNAFLNSGDKILSLNFDGSNLVNSPPEYDLYYAVNMLTNATWIGIAYDSATNDHIILDNAFHGVVNMRTLRLMHTNIERIGKNIVYNISTLNQIIITGLGNIGSISTEAFDFGSPSDQRLTINFWNQYSIVFEDNVFSGSKRPLYIEIGSHNYLSYIDENTFSAFFVADQRNVLSFASAFNSLNCADMSRYLWLFRQKELRNQLTNARCNSLGTFILDLEFIYVNWPTNIFIHNTTDLDIREEFQQISNDQSETEKHFNTLEIINPNLTELPENAFYDISVTEIYLRDLYNLRTINTNAFSGTESSVEILQIIGSNTLINSPPNNDLYAAISLLSNLKSVQIVLAVNVGHEIPINAFQRINGPQNSLENITFSGEFWIIKINDNAFTAIPNLKTIVFTSIAIHYINSKAFDFDVESPLDQPSHNSNDLIEINLNGCGLNESSFDNNVFSNSLRPLYVNLDYNQLHYFRESTFRAFLNANVLNNISLQNNPFDCNNIYEYEWIFSRKVDLENRVLNARCSNGINLWDLELPESTDLTTNYSTLPSTTTTTQNSIMTSTTVTPDSPLCNEDFSYNGQYYISNWPPVKPGETSYGECQTGYVGIAMWFCHNDSRFDINGPQITCTQSWIEDLYDVILDDNITSIDEVINYITILDEELDDSDVTYYEELVKIVEITEILQFYSNKLIDSNQYLNESIIITMKTLEIYSTLLSRSKPWIEANQTEKSFISEKIVLYVQYASFLLGCQLNSTEIESISMTNIYVENFKLNETGYTLESKRTNSTIIIPASLEISLPNLPDFCPNRTSFAVIFEKLDEYFSDNLKDSESIASHIIGFSFTNDTKTFTLNNGLKAKIILEHSNRLKFGDKIRCVFWDFAATRWSSDGCERIANESNRDITTCECNHLTNFAAIIDISGRQSDGGLKSTFTTVCSSMSCMGLIMTIIMIFLSKSHKRKKEKIAELRDTVTCNLCFCLIMVNLLVLFGMDQTNTKWLCQTLSALLLYSLLSAFCWMLFEGIIVYKMTVQVFPNYFRHIKLLNYMLAYGTPILVIIIAFTIVALINIYNDFAIFDVLFKDETNNYFCWISSSVTPYYIWIFAGPALMIMIANFIILILSIKSVCGALKPSYMLVIGYTSFTFFLGLTWLFFILYIEQFGHYFVFFSYFFIIINGSQGAFIHLFQTIHTSRTVIYVVDSSDGNNYES